MTKSGTNLVSKIIMVMSSLSTLLFKPIDPSMDLIVTLDLLTVYDGRGFGFEIVI